MRARFPELVRTVILRTTPHSLASFRMILGCSPPGRLLVATVDTLCATEDFVAFVREAERAPEEETVLAVTPLVADEKPLWVRRDAEGRVTGIGGPAGDAVTAGFYVVSPRARALEPPAHLGRLREYLAWLCASGEPIRAVTIERAVDIDRPEDIRLAEELFGSPAWPAAGAGR